MLVHGITPGFAAHPCSRRFPRSGRRPRRRNPALLDADASGPFPGSARLEKSAPARRPAKGRHLDGGRKGRHRGGAGEGHLSSFICCCHHARVVRLTSPRFPTRANKARVPKGRDARRAARAETQRVTRRMSALVDIHQCANNAKRCSRTGRVRTPVTLRTSKLNGPE